MFKFLNNVQFGSLYGKPLNPPPDLAQIPAPDPSQRRAEPEVVDEDDYVYDRHPLGSDLPRTRRWKTVEHKPSAEWSIVDTGPGTAEGEYGEYLRRMGGMDQ